MPTNRSGTSGLGSESGSRLQRDNSNRDHGAESPAGQTGTGRSANSAARAPAREVEAFAQQTDSIRTLRSQVEGYSRWYMVDPRQAWRTAVIDQAARRAIQGAAVHYDR